MTRLPRKLVLAGLAGLTAMVTLAACSSDSSGPSIPAVPTGLTVEPVNTTTAHDQLERRRREPRSYSLQRALQSAPTVYTDLGGAITGTTYDDATPDPARHRLCLPCGGHQLRRHQRLSAPP